MIGKARLGTQVAVYSLLFLNCILILFTFQFSIESFSLLKTFDNDGDAAITNVLQNLNENNFSPHGFFNYGYLYHTVTLVLLKILEVLNINVRDVKVIGNAFMCINLASYLGTVIVLQGIFKKLKVKFWIEAFALFFLINIPAVVNWTGRIHPDMLLTFLVVSSLHFFLKYALDEKSKNINLVLAFFVLGASFGVKYSSLMFTPVYGGFIIYKTFRQNEKPILKIFLLGMISLSMFLAGWLVFNQYVILNWREFISDFAFEMEHIRYGGQITDLLPSDQNPLLWIPVITFELSWIGWIFFGCGIILNIYFVIRSRNEKEKAIAVLILLLYLFPTAYTILRVVDRVPRYFIHLFPFGVLAASMGFSQLSSFVEDQLAENKIFQKAGPAIVFLILISGGLVIVQRRPYDGLLDKQKWGSAQKVTDGKWIESYLLNKSDVHLYAGYYSFLPDKLQPALTTTWYFDDFKEEFHNAVVINVNRPGKFVWKNQGTSFKEGKFTSLNEGNYQGSLNVYKLLLTDEWELIYEKSGNRFFG